MEAGVDFFEIIDLNPNTGTNETFLNDVNVQAFPNPSTNGFHLVYELPEGARQAQIVVYNILGQEQERFQLNQEQGQVHFSAQSKGIYLAQVVVDGQVSRSIKLMGK